MDEIDESQSASRVKPSKIPSWITLGFILGVLFVWALPRPKEPAAVAAPAPVEAQPDPVPTHPRLSDVEAVFAVWGRYAVWAGDVTYVCMWDLETKSFRDCFEVLRRGDNLYFRSVERPSYLRALTPQEGVPENSPLQFLNAVAETRGLFAPPRLARPVIAPAGNPATPLTVPPPENIPVEINPPKP